MTNDDYQKKIFEELPYCLRSYVDNKKWKAFREVQLKAFDIINHSENHLLLSAGTSSGKTEAALFPVIADICKNKPLRISAIYLSPLIALIDDQYGRVSEMLNDSGVGLFAWHGDISSSKKLKMLSSGEGILQITPESLEGLISRHYDELSTLFSELKYVIIDEIHSFMNSDRGLHLLCELEIIEKQARCRPRRIGLSATLSDYSIAEKWLKANTDRNVQLLECGAPPNYCITIDYDWFAPKNTRDRQKSLRTFYEKLYSDVASGNSIIFTNNRTSVENTVSGLKIIAEERNSNKQIYAHHSSVSKEYRTLAEEKMKDKTVDCVIVSTSTLELGIDVGDLDRVIHINAPQTVSSLVQKMGRSGRRTNTPILICRCNNKNKSKLEGVDLDLIKAIAEVELFLNEHWVEPINYSELPFSLLFQQITSYVRAHITAKWEELQKNVLGLYPFRKISNDDFANLINHMVETSVLEYTEYYKTFSLGHEGEYLTRQIDFGSNFFAICEYDVIHGKDKVGSIQFIPYVGELIQLAGKSWIVESIQAKSSQIIVSESHKTTETFWKSGRSDIHSKIMESIESVLRQTTIYQYLTENAKTNLIKSRLMFNILSGGKDIVKCGDQVLLFPWLGTIQFDTLLRVLSAEGIAIGSVPNYYIILKKEYQAEEIKDIFIKFKNTKNPLDLVTDYDVLTSKTLGKYNKYIPNELLKRQFVADRLDFSLFDKVK